LRSEHIIGHVGHSTNILIQHAFKVLFRTFFVADLGTGPARQPLHFSLERIGMGPVGIHTKHRHSAPPDGNDLFLKSSRNMHYPGVVRNDKTGLPDKRGGLVDGKETASVINCPFGQAAADLF